MRYFISYTTEDQSWAEWIAWQIESIGHETVIQAWDFMAGSNFVVKMQDACSNSDATIIVLSKAFIEKEFPAAEWSEAFSRDPTGKNRTLIPVRIDNVKPPGLLSTIVYIDSHNTPNEGHAANKLSQGIRLERDKPQDSPPFPNECKSLKRPPFPINTQNSMSVIEDDVEVEIEIKLNQDYEKFATSDQQKILGAVKELLKTNHSIKITNMRKGSVVLTVVLKREDALKLSILKYLNKLDIFIDDNDVVDISNPIILHMNFDDILREYNSYQEIPVKTSEKQEGTVVFVDEKANEGVILSEYGLYLRFRPGPSGTNMGIGSKVEYASDSVGAFEIFKSVHKVH
ncbi:toll/interleukin-1 receptor domain-containing protein [Teredinibacter turnerae]|uniref:toll/interleukin-1 receptor domain-containing protein n=1 Tax=Teredinibacter turnerae TaxID=2426 RepID=UPI00037AE630|nr:toll/interleukin-1 receptor domain-containing protein [Teredinibacter turnerae]